MNRYAIWKYVIIAIAIVSGLLYASPTLLRGYFGEAQTVQISAAKSANISEATVQQVQQVLAQANINPLAFQATTESIRIQFNDKEIRDTAKEALDKALNPDENNSGFIVAVNVGALTPKWLTSIGAKPVNLGLDLRGGVHFLLQVDMKAALTTRMESIAGGISSDLRKQNIRYLSVATANNMVDVVLPDGEALAAAQRAITSSEVTVTEDTSNGRFRLQVEMSPTALQQLQELALQQNINTLHNRINALGVAEPLIQQQGTDRIVVQLPGVHDTAQAKEVLGRTAALQIRMVDSGPQAIAALEGRGPLPIGTEKFFSEQGEPLVLKREVLLTGERLNDATSGLDQEKNMPAVFLNFDSQGARIFYDITRQNRGQRMAIVLFEKGQGTVVTAPSIDEPIPGGRVRISGGMMGMKEAQNIALLLRSGSLATPMEVIEERTIEATLGEENIGRGVNSVIYGFAIVAGFMMLYYRLFGVFSTISMAVNALLLITILALLQATLTLPGIAAMALALGMAIDANVLINERIREELRAGATPQMAINAGYEHAWGTILDSNITSLIAGIALLTCDAGPIRGFAVVHCLGILTSLFSSVFVSRGLVNLWYGRRRKLTSLAIGQVWKPQQD